MQVPRGFCGYCQRDRQLRDDGTLRTHNKPHSIQRCQGAHQLPEETPMAKSEPVPVTGAWLRRIGIEAQLLLEIDGQWRLIVAEPVDGPFSHITEARAFADRPLDRVAYLGDAEERA